ncbi:MAG: hypothetical protein C4527_13250 [Candidatus Omnitrophota bacterium]|jgi:N-acetylneuraminate synthase/N,N'-diacetyllegionaminate synthase|nr:MAG: hypothetical protein C4527_13250 [Candidatus Omnitrophota bacterium]
MSHPKHTITIDHRIIGDGHPCLIIAEIGINHDGCLTRAHEMIEAAKQSGADAVKFQTVDPDASYVPESPSYQAFSGKGFTESQYRELIAHCRELNMIFFTTPGDFPSLRLCQHLQLPALKISSGLFTNLPLILEATRLGIPLIISTGMSYLWEISRLVTTLESQHFFEFALLHCVSTYPVAEEKLNLRAIEYLKTIFPYPIGYSNHCLHPLACSNAVAAGACILEQHFTLDRSLPNADHSISMEPDAFAVMVENVRSTEKMLGRADKRPTDEELQAKDNVRRYLVANCDITKGQPFNSVNVGIKRLVQQTGLTPEFHEFVLGKRAGRDMNKNEPIRLYDLLEPEWH